jgi:hypothetical protein
MECREAESRRGLGGPSELIKPIILSNIPAFIIQVSCFKRHTGFAALAGARSSFFGILKFN